MLNPGINRYKTVQVRTSSPSELLTMLYDGCFRFMNEGLAAMEQGNRPRAAERLDRAYAIMSEFAATLKHEVWPDLCQNLDGIYTFCMGQLVQANIEQNPQKVRDVIRVLEPLRDAFKEAARQVISGEAKLEAHSTAAKR